MSVSAEMGLLEYLARRKFDRQAADYDADPALAELAWLDPGVRNFHVGEAQAVLDDIAAYEGRVA